MTTEPQQSASTRAPLHQQQWLAVTISVVGVAMVAVVVLLAVLLGQREQSPLPVAPDPAADKLTPAQHMDAVIDGVGNGLELRSTWGGKLTRESAASTCNARAQLAYPSSPAAVRVFADACTDDAVPN